jgi:hypothetical protein
LGYLKIDFHCRQQQQQLVVALKSCMMVAKRFGLP